jgi:GNAT superfamily N-acetyltransferase
MTHEDVQPVADAFASMNKTREQYERYFHENVLGSRVTLVAAVGDAIVGYANVLWSSQYEPFCSASIPEINDLNVVEVLRNRGIGRALIRECERIVKDSGKPVIGIGVGLTPDYAAAQHLYPKLGYIPDGRAIYTSEHGDESYFTKELLSR